MTAKCRQLLRPQSPYADRMLSPAAVIFDLDGTLVDDASASDLALRSVISEYPEISRLDFQIVREEWRRDFAKLWRPVAMGEVSVLENRVIRFGNIFGAADQNLPREEAVEMSLRYDEIYLSGMKRIPGALELIYELKSLGCRMGILTNHSYEYQKNKLAKAGYPEFYGFFVSPEQVRAMKPERRIFEAALERCNAPPSSVVMIGDSFADDVVGASNAGINPIWFNRFGVSRPTVDFDFRELTSYLPLDRALAVITSTRGNRNSAHAKFS